MGVKIASEQVANMLNQWYGQIKQQDIHSAKIMRSEIEETMKNMEQDQNVLLYFNMIDSRYKLLLENYTESGSLLKSLKNQTEENKTDDMLQYYFYFFSGLYEFYVKNFTKAINFYRIAESKLHKIPDEIENAEFHYQVAIAYYKIKQHFFSLNHIEKALASFKAYEEYSNRAIKSTMVLAANYVDLYRFDEAIKLYKQAVEKARITEDAFSESLAYFNLGVCYERLDHFSEAMEYLQKAIDIPENRQSVSAIRTMYMLSRVLYKTNSLDEARAWYQKSLSKAEEAADFEYKAKLQIIYSLYDQHDSACLDEGLEQLKNKKLWSDVAELTSLAAYHYKKEGDIHNSAKYFEQACHAKDQILKLTEVLS
ncbi:Rap family tetratricopeptide repeat protein [Bacillus glycinifermentans]|uniref:Rap family tetratricopeptide repeat protein n=1 Tax=Bacillus glycinifermentans TaxID=1664069 RepID=UPI001FF45798|nr:Rap family tetratricopeptide repeat protein [Bacillus glycinifermentans]UOY88647.1 tetratricopeptide repeat protein [Bacillus glycinifermentans]